MAYRELIKTPTCEACGKIPALYRVNRTPGPPVGNYCEVCSQKKLVELRKLEDKAGPGWA